MIIKTLSTKANGTLFMRNRIYEIHEYPIIN